MASAILAVAVLALIVVVCAEHERISRLEEQRDAADRREIGRKLQDRASGAVLLDAAIARHPAGKGRNLRAVDGGQR